MFIYVYLICLYIYICVKIIHVYVNVYLCVYECGCENMYILKICLDQSTHTYICICVYM